MSKQNRALHGAWLVVLTLAGCHPTPSANPHYMLGQPYQSGGTWWYPRESYDLDETGLAEIYPDGHPLLTSDGELFTQNALAVAHATLQLPAIARLTDLETGRSIFVRVNDRGAASPHDLVQVTRRVADLLGMRAGVAAEVRLTVLAGESATAVERIGGEPRMSIAAAPVGSVTSASLPPLAGAREESGHVLSAAPAVSATDAPAPVQRLPETVTQGAPRPGRLWVRLDTFQSYEYAAIEQARLAGLSPRIDRIFVGRTESYRVIIGPIGSVAEADAVVDQAVRAGVNDARIVVE